MSRKPELKLVPDTGSELDADPFGPPPQQAEMPFAVVEGEPITQLPKDLYIPPDALQVFLEAFEGPLDLLLYLIRRQNLDVLDIPIAEITRQYMQYIEVMQELQLELAGEYLLMAAMLAEIKSRMLLPSLKKEGDEEEDPRAELVRRLQEYERFKKAAEDLDRLPRMERDAMATSVEIVERKVARVQPEVSLKEMLLAFKDVLSRADMFAHHHIRREQLSVRQRMSDILDRLRTAAFIEFIKLFDPAEGRMGVTVTFIAMLELMKEGLLEIVQAQPYAPIHVRPASGKRHLSVVSDGTPEVDPDAENVAALAQPAYPDENDDPDDEPATQEAGNAAPVAVLDESPAAVGEAVAADASAQAATLIPAPSIPAELVPAELAPAGLAKESSPAEPPALASEIAIEAGTDPSAVSASVESPPLEARLDLAPTLLEPAGEDSVHASVDASATAMIAAAAPLQSNAADEVITSSTAEVAENLLQPVARIESTVLEASSAGDVAESVELDVIESPAVDVMLVAPPALLEPPPDEVTASDAAASFEDIAAEISSQAVPGSEAIASATSVGDAAASAVFDIVEETAADATLVAPPALLEVADEVTASDASASFEDIAAEISSQAVPGSEAIAPEATSPGAGAGSAPLDIVEELAADMTFMAPPALLEAPPDEVTSSEAVASFGDMAAEIQLQAVAGGEATALEAMSQGDTNGPVELDVIEAPAADVALVVSPVLLEVLPDEATASQTVASPDGIAVEIPSQTVAASEATAVEASSASDIIGPIELDVIETPAADVALVAPLVLLEVLPDEATASAVVNSEDAAAETQLQTVAESEAIALEAMPAEDVAAPFELDLIEEPATDMTLVAASVSLEVSPNEAVASEALSCSEDVAAEIPAPTVFVSEASVPDTPPALDVAASIGLDVDQPLAEATFEPQWAPLEIPAETETHATATETAAESSPQTIDETDAAPSDAPSAIEVSASHEPHVSASLAELIHEPARTSFEASAETVFASEVPATLEAGVAESSLQPVAGEAEPGAEPSAIDGIALEASEATAPAVNDEIASESDRGEQPTLEMNREPPRSGFELVAEGSLAIESLAGSVQCADEPSLPNVRDAGADVSAESTVATEPRGDAEVAQLSSLETAGEVAATFEALPTDDVSAFELQISPFEVAAEPGVERALEQVATNSTPSAADLSSAPLDAASATLQPEPVVASLEVPPASYSIEETPWATMSGFEAAAAQIEAAVASSQMHSAALAPEMPPMLVAEVAMSDSLAAALPTISTLPSSAEATSSAPPQTFALPAIWVESPATIATDSVARAEPSAAQVLEAGVASTELDSNLAPAPVGLEFDQELEIAAEELASLNELQNVDALTFTDLEHELAALPEQREPALPTRALEETESAQLPPPLELPSGAPAALEQVEPGRGSALLDEYPPAPSAWLEREMSSDAFYEVDVAALNPALAGFEHDLTGTSRFMPDPEQGQ